MENRQAVARMGHRQAVARMEHRQAVARMEHGQTATTVGAQTSCDYGWGTDKL